MAGGAKQAAAIDLIETELADARAELQELDQTADAQCSDLLQAAASKVSDLEKALESANANVGSSVPMTAEQAEIQLSKLENDEKSKELLIERLSSRRDWISERASEHEDWKRRIAGSAAPTVASRIMDDWHSHTSVHATACLWQQVTTQL